MPARPPEADGGTKLYGFLLTIRRNDRKEIMKNIKNLVILFILILLSVSFLHAGNVKVLSRNENSLSLLYTFEKPQVSEKNGINYITVRGCKPLLDIGKPVIPVRTAKILLPFGTNFNKNVNVIADYSELQGTYKLKIAEKPERIGDNSGSDTPNPETSTLPPGGGGVRRGGKEFTGVFPDNSFQILDTQKIRGYKIGIVRLYPVKYDGSTGKIQYTENIRVNISFEKEVSALKAGKISPGIRTTAAADKNLVSKFVDNPSEVVSYGDYGKTYSPLQNYKYVVITNELLQSSFQPLINEKIAGGLTATIVTTEDILTNPASPYYQSEGRDNAEKVRNFIIWAYNNWNTDYILLGGDTEVIPVRYFDSPIGWGSIPSDVYYSNLDGDFDYDGDSNFGEYGDGPGGGEVDLIADVYVGRAPVSTQAETTNFVNKTLSYTSSNTYSVKKSGFTGNQLDDIPTWGGDAKDAIIRDCVPADWDVDTFYDRDCTYEFEVVKDYINNGTHFINFFSHGSSESCMGFEASDVQNLINTMYLIFYSQGCDNCAFDNPPESADAIGEYFVTSPKGAVSFIGNTRYGWYSPGNPESGPSQLFDKEFFNVIFNENIVGLGESFHRSKENLIGVMGSYERYVYYELVLFGDPSLTTVEKAVYPPEEVKGLLYYVKENNIWSLDLSTDESNQLTHFLTGTVQSPLAAENGQKIIFSYFDGSNYNLYLVNSDGSGVQNLTEDYNLDTLTVDQKYGVLSPNQELLAFTAEDKDPGVPGDAQLWLKELTGQKRLYQLTFNRPFDGVPWNCSYPVFVDNSHILFKTRLINESLEDYYLISTSGANPTNITNNDDYSPNFPKLGRPLLNKEKTQIIYGKQTQDEFGYSDWEIYTRPVWGGGELKILTDLFYAEVPASQPDPMPAFVDDGKLIFTGEDLSGDKYLYFTLFNSDNPYLKQLAGTENGFYPFYFLPLPTPTQFVYVMNGEIYLRNSDGEDVQLTDTGPYLQENDPSFDISGNYITYSGNGIWVMKSDGTDSVQVDDTFAARYPAISPDGNWVAYVKNNDIYARRIDKSVLPVRLTGSSTVAKLDLSFSPDGTKILYTGSTASGFQIFCLPVTIFDSEIRVDGNSVNLTDNPGHDNSHASYSIDGNSIIFVSTRLGGRSLFLMDSDGTNQRQIQLNPVPVNPAYPLFSPYGEEKIAYLSNGEIYEADLTTEFASSVQPEINTGYKFDWGKYISEKIQITREFIFDKADPDIPFIYNLIVKINEVSPPSTIILQEMLPTIADGAAVNWELEESTWNDSPLSTSNGQTTGTLKWIIGITLPLDEEGIEEGILKLKINISGDVPEGAVRSLNGGYLEGEKFSYTGGDAYIILGQPYCPVDIDQDWEISDEELLSTIDYWADGSQLHGWPVDAYNDWDYWLLKVIDFWANDSYEYDSAGSQTAEEPRWQK